MACILKAPVGGVKGVVVFTTQERDRVILNNRKLQDEIHSLKNNWVVGLHHNWHDYNFTYNPLFDFSLAGEEDLMGDGGKIVPLIPMDACNFVPDFFRPSGCEKVWDILYIARAVYFKRIPEFFKCIRSLFDDGHRYKVLFICPIPPFDLRNMRNMFFNIRKVYDRMFFDKEKRIFNLLAIDYGYPFPFDLETLAHFYKSSRIFVHFSDDERRCRVAAYAWSSGIPVVGMTCVGSLLPPNVRVKPYFYNVHKYSEFPNQIVAALDENSKNPGNFDQVRKIVSAIHTEPELIKRLEDFFLKMNLPFSRKGCLFSNLDIRLGRHHGIGKGPNTVLPSLYSFVKMLNESEMLDDAIFNHSDPEKEIEKKYVFKTRLPQG
jgi:glycosyltransferase involved in cell wall biosynthesis